jgi:hypothetical protein
LIECRPEVDGMGSILGGTIDARVGSEGSAGVGEEVREGGREREAAGGVGADMQLWVEEREGAAPNLNLLHPTTTTTTRIVGVGRREVNRT